MSLPDSEPLVLIVDDDVHVREGLADLIQSLGYSVRAFTSAEEYLEFARPDVPACLVLDVELPGMSGLEFQDGRGAGVSPPIVFITGQGDIRSSVQAIQRGAVDFLTKPLREAELVRAIEAALERDRRERGERDELTLLRQRYARLTPREREVMALVVRGRLNKQVAADLGISEVTVQIHRRRLMRKMSASSLASLVRMAVALGL